MKIRSETAALAVLHGVVTRIDRESGSAKFTSDEHERMVAALEVLVRANALRVAQGSEQKATQEPAPTFSTIRMPLKD